MRRANLALPIAIAFVGCVSRADSRKPVVDRVLRDAHDAEFVPKCTLPAAQP